MHPVYAAKSCDPEGEYVRFWLPVLGQLPIEYIHCPWEAPFSMRAAAKVVLGSNYPHRILTNLEGARRRSHAAVMAVRRGVGARQVLPSGHEWYELENGKRVTLITRQDYREGTTTREGKLITGDEIVTRQTAEPHMDIRRREKTDSLSIAMRDSSRGASQEDGARDEMAGAHGSGRGRGGGRGRGRGARGRSSRGRGPFSQPQAWG